MRLGQFFWKVFLGNAAILVLTLSICIWLIVAEFDRFQAEYLTPYLHNYAQAVLVLVEDQIEGVASENLQNIINRVDASHPDAVRVTVVSIDGAVLADSQGNPAVMDNHKSRPEIEQANQRGHGESERWSDSVHRTMKYVALRVDREGRPVGIVRVAMPVRTLMEKTRAASRLLGPIGVVLLIAALGMAVGLALLWSSRIRRLTAAAQSLSRGDLGSPIPVIGSDEVASLAKALERMRSRLNRQVDAIIRQRTTLEAMVGELEEGVVVADAEGRVLLINPAAGRLLSFEGPANSSLHLDSRARIETVVSQHDLQRLMFPSPGLGGETAAQTVSEGGAEELSFHPIRLDQPGSAAPKYVLAKANNIAIGLGGAEGVPQAESAQTGRLLVLTDVTELMRAIRSRSDFVANASHELRTPVAAIRAGIETLMQMKLSEEEQAAARFLAMINRQASRLESLVKDLLDLARVESAGARFEPATLYMERVLSDLRARWEEERSAKNLQWETKISPDSSEFTANAHLLSLVLDNLVDNAIKFTPEGGAISIHTWAEEDRVLIEVKDTGCGIPPQDQSRVFERFYQVDAVRTGTGSDRRGTGLGLSIVRHAVTAMGGGVRLESEVGRGTQVTIEFPRYATEKQ